MKIIVYIVLILFVFRPLFPVVEHLLNYEYIATKLCENKDKPELKCNGKCHLMKELDKASETEKPINDNSKKITLEKENLYIVDFAPINFTTITHQNIKVDDFYTCIYFHKHITSVFHPPTLSDLFC